MNECVCVCVYCPLSSARKNRLNRVLVVAVVVCFYEHSSRKAAKLPTTSAALLRSEEDKMPTEEEDWLADWLTETVSFSSSDEDGCSLLAFLFQLQQHHHHDQHYGTLLPKGRVEGH